METRIQDEPWYKRNNAVEMKPWVWATLPGQKDPVELISFPWWEESEKKWKVNVRMTIGDPTTLKTVDAQSAACFDPTSHERYYELTGDKHHVGSMTLDEYCQTPEASLNAKSWEEGMKKPDTHDESGERIDNPDFVDLTGYRRPEGPEVE